MTTATTAKAPPVPPCPSWCGRAGRGHRWVRDSGGCGEGLIVHERSTGTVHAVSAALDVKVARYDYLTQRDGRVELTAPEVWLDDSTYEMTPAQARRLGRMLIDAAKLAETT